MTSAKEDLKRGTEHFVSSAETYHKGLNGSASGWVHDLRLMGLETFKSRGIPTTKLEGWRYTNLRPLLAKQFSQGVLPVLDFDSLSTSVLPVDGRRVVLNNGHLDTTLSELENLPDGVVICSLEEALIEHSELLKSSLVGYNIPKDEIFAALNAAHLGSGLFVHIPKNVVFQENLHVVYVSGSAQEEMVAHPRLIVLMSENSQLTIVESYVGIEGTSYLNNQVTQVHLEQNAVMNHIRLQNENGEAFHLSGLVVHQERSSQFNSHLISLGAQIARTNIEAVVDGPGADCRLQGLYLADEKRHAGIHIVMDHAKPHCDSLQKFKGVLSDKATSVFDARVLVREGADKTDAVQQNNNLLLSRNAQANTRPQLEIYADDVKCAHGATVGQLDENQVFYLRSRGLDEDVAKRELTYAFANDVLESISDQKVREKLESLVRTSLT